MKSIEIKERLSARTTATRQRQAQLEQSEEILAALYNSMPIGTYVVQDGKFRLASLQFQQITGYNEEELIGMDSFNLVLPEDRNTVKENAVQMLKGELRRPYEYRVVNKSGDAKWIVETVTSIQYRGHRSTLGNFMDITAYALARQELQENNADLEKLNARLRKTESALEERVKELTCLYEVTRVTEKPNLSIENIYQEVADILPCGMMFPEDTCACVTVNDKKYKTANYKSSQMKISAGITVHGEKAGTVEICRLKSTKQSEDALFLKEEEKLIQNVASKLSQATERQQAEERIIEAEKLMRSYLKKAPDGIYISDLKGAFIYGNDKAEEITGYKREELIGKNFLQLKLLPAKYLKKAAGLLARSAAGKTTGPDELELVRKDGGRVFVEITTTSVTRYGGKVVLGFVRDVTRRREEEEISRFSMAAFKSLHESMTAIDSKSRITHWNEISEQMYGIKASEAIGKYLSDVIDVVEQYPGHKAERLRQLETAGYLREEQLQRTRNKEIWVDVTLQPIEKGGKRYGWVALANDITERKKAENALKESEERYRDLFENTNDLIQSVSSDGRFIYTNNAWRKELGYGEEEISHMCLLDIIHPGSQAHCLETFNRVLTGENEEFVEAIFVASDGREIAVEGSANCRYIDGKPAYTRAIFRDVTERKKAEDALKELNYMKSEFLSNVSHELRNPLHSINGFSKIMLDEENLPDEMQREFLTIIGKESRRLTRLIDSLLDMSRLESGRFEMKRTKDVNIKTIITETANGLFGIASDKKITVKTEFTEELPAIEADEERIRQVLTNLLSNAIKFSEDGGNITVQAGTKDSNILVQVTDNGIGISKEAMRHLFEKFYRAEDNMARGGTGLGLYISKQIVEAHNGQIWAESKAGKGSTFRFTLPID
ncbi:PAS domain S-box protein [Chloroflexota bacterium]